MATDRLGIRAITMQQPFAAAMVAGEGLYTRRGRSVAFGKGVATACADEATGGEWVAVHCGRNDVHIRNKSLMAAVRKHWPACPSDEELRRGQACLLGVVRIVDGGVDMKRDPGANSCFYLARYDCSKPYAWRADCGRALPAPIPYPRGQVQVWHIKRGGFTGSKPRADAAALLALTGSAPAASSVCASTAAGAGADAEVQSKRSAGSGGGRSRRQRGVKREPDAGVKLEQPEAGVRATGGTGSATNGTGPSSREQRARKRARVKREPAK